MDIEDTHPLRERVTMEELAPKIFRGCFKKKKKNFKSALRRAMLEDIGIKVPKSEGEIDADPFLILGYGVNAYFDILESLSSMFFMITIFAIPIFMIYAGGDSYTDQISRPIS